MGSHARSQILISCLGLVTVATLVGCGGGGDGSVKMLVRDPVWPFRDYDRIAVVPAAYVTPAAAAEAETLTTVLTDELARSGAFTLVSRQELASVLKEQDLAQLSDVVDPSTVIPPGGIQVAEVLITPRITQYDLDSRSEQKQRMRFQLVGGRLRPTQVLVTENTNTAVLAASVRVIDAETGAIIYASPAEPIERSVSEDDALPEQTPEQLAAFAARDLAIEFARDLAPSQVEVEFEPEMLKVASSYYDGAYDEQNNFEVAANNSIVIAVVGLPQACVGHEFRIAITPEESRRDVFGGPNQEVFTWSSGADVRRGVSFTVPMSALEASGASAFTAKLYWTGDDAPAITKNFTLEFPKQSS